MLAATAGVAAADAIYMYSKNMKIPKNWEKFLELSFNDQLATGCLAGNRHLM